MKRVTTFFFENKDIGIVIGFVFAFRRIFFVRNKRKKHSIDNFLKYRGFVIILVFFFCMIETVYRESFFDNDKPYMIEYSFYKDVRKRLIVNTMITVAAPTLLERIRFYSFFKKSVYHKPENRDSKFAFREQKDLPLFRVLKIKRKKMFYSLMYFRIYLYLTERVLGFFRKELEVKLNPEVLHDSRVGIFLFFCFLNLYWFIVIPTDRSKLDSYCHIAVDERRGEIHITYPNRFLVGNITLFSYPENSYWRMGPFESTVVIPMNENRDVYVVRVPKDNISVSGKETTFHIDSEFGIIHQNTVFDEAKKQNICFATINSEYSMIFFRRKEKTGRLLFQTTGEPINFSEFSKLNNNIRTFQTYRQSLNDHMKKNTKDWIKTFFFKSSVVSDEVASFENSKKSDLSYKINEEHSKNAIFPKKKTFSKVSQTSLKSKSHRHFHSSSIMS